MGRPFGDCGRFQVVCAGATESVVELCEEVRASEPVGKRLDRTFASSKLKCIFEKIEDFASISPRTVWTDKNQAGEHWIVVQLHDGSVEGE